MRRRHAVALPLLLAVTGCAGFLLAVTGCGVGSLAPRVSLTLGRSVRRDGLDSAGRTHATGYALLTTTLVREPPAPPLVVTRPATTPLPALPICLEGDICAALEDARRVALRREMPPEEQP